MHRIVASWFGTGLLLRRLRGSDAGSGTVGSAATLGLALLLGPDRWGWQLAAAVLVSAAAVWSSSRFAGEGDPGWVVADEAAGTLVATIGLSWLPALIAFAVFRLVDATKRAPGMAAAERLPGGWGITADDVLAGGYALAAGWIATSFL